MDKKYTYTVLEGQVEVLVKDEVKQPKFIHTIK